MFEFAEVGKVRQDESLRANFTSPLKFPKARFSKMLSLSASSESCQKGMQI